MQRHDVASTLRRRCINVKCPLGYQIPKKDATFCGVYGPGCRQFLQTFMNITGSKQLLEGIPHCKIEFLYNMSVLVGHFVFSPRERENKETRARRREEWENRGKYEGKFEWLCSKRTYVNMSPFLTCCKCSRPLSCHHPPCSKINMFSCKDRYGKEKINTKITIHYTPIQIYRKFHLKKNLKSFR